MSSPSRDKAVKAIAATSRGSGDAHPMRRRALEGTEQTRASMSTQAGSTPADQTPDRRCRSTHVVALSTQARRQAERLRAAVAVVEWSGKLERVAVAARNRGLDVALRNAVAGHRQGSRCGGPWCWLRLKRLRWALVGFPIGKYGNPQCRGHSPRIRISGPPTSLFERVL